jgi:hypothetical protein
MKWASISKASVNKLSRRNGVINWLDWKSLRNLFGKSTGEKDEDLTNFSCTGQVLSKIHVR